MTVDPLTRSVAQRFAATTRLDFAWVEKLRRDFLTLLKNLPRVKDYKTAHELREAVKVYRNNFDELFFENFLNKLKDNPRDENSGWINSYWEGKLRTTAWTFSSELSVPIGFSSDYYSEEARFESFLKDFPAWKTRVQRKGAAFWKEMKEVLEELGRHNKPGIDVEVPTVENATIEGFKLVMKGFKPDDEYNQRELEVFKEGLRLYRRRAGAVAPILLQRQLPVICEFKSTLDKGGEYDHGGFITFYMSSIISKGVPWVAHVMAHEMGHHLWRTSLSGDATDFWYQTIKGDYGDIDLKELLDKWPGDTWAYDFPRIMGDTDPILALQVDAVSEDRLQSKEDFQKLYDSGQRTLRVPTHPITGYANKNPEEAFCETIGMLIAYGPKAIHERVRMWLDTAMPGAVKVASLVARVVAGFKSSEVLK